MSFDSFLKERKTLVKICGVQTVEAAQTAIQSGADLVGIICVPNRSRTVVPQVARRISELMHDPVTNSQGAKLVGVFRNQSVDDVQMIAGDYGVDVVQLHGDESWEEYHEEVNLPIIKSVVFPRDCELVQRLSHQKTCECLPVFDAEVGGTGEKLDWGAIGQWSKGQAKFILAGGLTPDNVKVALQVPGAIGVDVSGGVETNGAKDLDKIKAFVANARNT